MLLKLNRWFVLGGSELFHGEFTLQRYLKCLQLLLWTQVPCMLSSVISTHTETNPEPKELTKLFESSTLKNDMISIPIGLRFRQSKLGYSLLRLMFNRIVLISPQFNSSFPQPLGWNQNSGLWKNSSSSGQTAQYPSLVRIRAISKWPQANLLWTRWSLGYTTLLALLVHEQLIHTQKTPNKCPNEKNHTKSTKEFLAASRKSRFFTNQPFCTQNSKTIISRTWLRS